MSKIDSENEDDSAEGKLKRLSRAISLSSLGIWEYDIKANQVWWSEEVYNIYDMDLQSDVPTLDKVFDHATPEEKEEIESIINQAIATGKEYVVDCRIKTKLGKYKYVNAIGKPHYDSTGELTHLFGTVMDITDRREKQQQFRFADFTLKSVSDGIYWIDANAKFIQANPGAANMLGYEIDELAGLSGKDINPDFNEQKSKEYWKITKEKGTFTFETEHRRKNGEMVPVEITNNVFNFEGQEYRVSIVRDITERKKREKEILESLEEVRQLRDQLQQENIYLRKEVKIDFDVANIITENPQLQEVLLQARQVSETDATVLITGESGTGKELMARAIHNLSNRRSRAMIKVNCASLPESLIESELFGHEKGSFTGALQQKMGRFELANGGTLFLDEIGELPPSIQVKLLRVLQEREFERVGGTTTVKVDVRIIAATNKNLEEEVAEGKFREDLYYRINVFPLPTIALRDRPEDIPPLVRYFIDKYSRKSGKEIDRISKKAMEALQQYTWPGNVRELENIMERAVILSTGKVIDAGAWLPKSKMIPSRQVKSLEQMEKDYLKEILEMTHGKISGPDGAAKLLEVNQNTLYSRLKKHGMLP
ncbi:MAG: sigma 54-interacting transcriptional regulator [Cytophagales bacterium]|nr:sigma 54-interacting transcriptional regulator [Cytophagales bacterium]